MVLIWLGSIVINIRAISRLPIRPSLIAFFSITSYLSNPTFQRFALRSFSCVVVSTNDHRRLSLHGLLLLSWNNRLISHVFFTPAPPIRINTIMPNIFNHVLIDRVYGTISPPLGRRLRCNWPQKVLGGSTGRTPTLDLLLSVVVYPVI